MSPHHSKFTAIACLAIGVALSAWPSVARADDNPELPPTQQVIDVVGFTPDGKSVVLRIDDENAGLLFQVRDIKRGSSEAVYPFVEDAEKTTWRMVTRKHKLNAEWAGSQENTKKKVTVMTEVREDKICIFMMRGETIKLYDELPLHKSSNGKYAESYVKAAVWGPKGKHLVLVYNQKTREKLSWEGDFVHAMKFKSYKVSFGGGAEPK